MTVLFCLFFQLFSAAHAEGWRDYIPTHEHYLKAHRWIIEHSSRETRLFLYTNIPSLFPVELLCQLREGAQKTAVLPGDSFRVQSDKAELDCKGLVQATFSKGTAGSVDTASGDPVITLTQGGADIATAGKPVSLQLPDYTLKVTHSDPSTLFSLRQNDQGSLILCKHGLAEATVATAPEGNANQKFLASA
ncbi:MAG: hypothetical protein ACXWQO_18680, partial [Bdellovibrionota bacterium]